MRAGLSVDKRQYIYLAITLDGELIKGGQTTNLVARLRALSIDCQRRFANRSGLRFLAIWPTNDSDRDESELLRALYAWRVSGEWFNASARAFEIADRHREIDPSVFGIVSGPIRRLTPAEIYSLRSEPEHYRLMCIESVNVRVARFEREIELRLKMERTIADTLRKEFGIAGCNCARD